MSYYQGDFYRGDFYQGDPGFFSRVRGLIGMGVSMIPGGEIFGRAISGMGSRAAAGMATASTSIARRGVAAVRGHPVLSAAGAAGVLGAAAGAEARGLMAPGAIPKGFHMSKPRKGHPSHLVRNRHMRATNVKALRRGLRRIHSFSRIARRVIHITHPRRGATVRFKFRRKRKSV